MFRFRRMFQSRNRAQPPEISRLLEEYEKVLPGSRQRLLAMRQYTSDWREAGLAIEEAMHQVLQEIITEMITETKTGGPGAA